MEGVLKVIPGHCHLFEMETSCKSHFPSVCDCSHPPLPASLGPCTCIHVPTRSPAEHLSQDGLAGVMSVEGFRDISTCLRPAGWSKRCQDWTFQTPWAHQFHPSWLAGMSHLFQACLALNQHPTLPPLASRLASTRVFRGFRAGAVLGTQGALNYTCLSNDRYKVLRVLGRFLAFTNFTDQFSPSHLLILRVLSPLLT